MSQILIESHWKVVFASKHVKHKALKSYSKLVFGARVKFTIFSLNQRGHKAECCCQLVATNNNKNRRKAESCSKVRSSCSFLLLLLLLLIRFAHTRFLGSNLDLNIFEIIHTIFLFRVVSDVVCCCNYNQIERSFICGRVNRA